MKRLLRFAVPVIVIALAFLAMRVLLGLREDSPRRAAPPRVLRVNATPVSLGAVPTEIVAYGRARSAQPVDLVSEVSGIVEAGDAPFRPGRRFRQGDLLVKVDDRPQRLKLASMRSQLLSALASVLPEIKVEFPERYPAWKDYFDRCDIERGIPDLPEAKDSRLKLFLARQRVHELYYGIREQEILLAKHRFVAPFDGVIAVADLREGATVRAGSRVGRVLNLDDLEVEVSVPADELAWLDRSAVVRLRDAETGAVSEGRVARVGAAVDMGTETVPVYLSLAGSAGEGFVDGAFLEAHFAGRAIVGAVALPQEALQGGEGVYLVEGGRLSHRLVQVARREKSRVIVARGLAEGDSVITDLLQGVTPGMPVQPRGALADDRRDPPVAEGRS